MLLLTVPTPPTHLAPRAQRSFAKAFERAAAAGAILVDGNNVRAAAGFRMAPLDVAACIDEWTAKSALSGRVIQVWDHGNSLDAALLPHSACVLSGPDTIADDIIVQACAFLPDSPLLVVSSDNGLCGRAFTQLAENRIGRELSTMHSIHYAWLLEAAVGDDDRWVASSRAARGRREGTGERQAGAADLEAWLPAAAAAAPSWAPDAPAARLATWIGGGRDGLVVARASRSFNDVYAIGL
jgi:hypothetical protein